MQFSTRDLLTRSWLSQANISLFLLLLIFVAFVLPSIGLEKHSLPLYGDLAATLVVVVGAAIAWPNRRLFLLTSLAVIVAIVLRWATWWTPTHTLSLWSASTGMAAIIMIIAVLQHLAIQGLSRWTRSRILFAQQKP